MERARKILIDKQSDDIDTCQVGNNQEETEQLLAEHNSFKEKARETREKVLLLHCTTCNSLLHTACR